MQYDKNRFTIRALPHPLILFWVLYPGVILHELILGQRLPKVTLIDKESDKPRMERTYVPCPHCETLNDRRLWAEGIGIAFGQWFGLVCPSCHQVIPCLWNIFSLAILAVTLPLWYFPARFFRRRWLEKEKERLVKVLEHPLIQAKSTKWLSVGTGVVAGVSTWVMCVMFDVLWNVWNGREWDLKTMLDSLSIYMVPGFVVGSSMIWIEKDKERLANVLERPLIQAKSINWFELRWFVRGTFYLGGFMWVAFAVWVVLEGREWDLRIMFDMLTFCLLAGWILGALMHVGMNLNGRKT